MADRGSVFSDPRVIAAAADFVCAADEVWRLQRGSEPDCLFFQRAVNGGERILDRGTRQGTWVFAPSGRLLARVNTRDVERQLAVLAEGLAAFEALAPEELEPPDGVDLAPGHRWEASFPADGLALERIARDLEPSDAGGLGRPLAGRWNRDFVWTSAAEVADALPEALEVGASFPLERLALRLARFHLVDNVRGQTLPFAEEEVREATLVVTVTAVSGGRATLLLAGATRAEAAPEWLLGDNAWTPQRYEPHGIACLLAGTATVDLGARRFEAFELVALGERWGRAGVNARPADGEPTPVAFHLAPTTRRIAPAFVDVYDAPWIEAPETGTWRDSPAECGLEEPE